MKEDSPSIGAAVIVGKGRKDELKRLLDQLTALDQVVVADNSGEGAIRNVCRKFANVDHFATEWRDTPIDSKGEEYGLNEWGFSFQRNVSLQHLKTDYGFWIDTDDMLGLTYGGVDREITAKAVRDGFLKIIKEAPDVDVWFADYHYSYDENHNPNVVHARERLFKNPSSWKVVYPIHECFIPDHAPRSSVIKDIKFLHIPTEKPEISASRNMRMLLDWLKQLEKVGNVYDMSRCKLLIGETYWGLRDYKSAADWLENEYLAKHPMAISMERWQACSFAAKSYIQIGNLAGAERMALQSIKLEPGLPDGYFLLAEIKWLAEEDPQDVLQLLEFGGRADDPPPYVIKNPLDYCVDEQTEILTRSGWKAHGQLVVDEKVLALNHETGEAEWQPVEEVCVFPMRSRQMLSIETRRHSSLTTLNHRWPVLKYDFNKWPSSRREWTTSEELLPAHRILTSAPVAGLPVESQYSDAFVELAAWYFTEGWPDKTSGGVSIAQKKSPGLRRIREALENCFPPEVNPSWTEYKPRRDGVITFRIAARFGRELRRVVEDKAPTLEFIYSLTSSQLELFIEVCELGDGSNSQTVSRNDFIQKSVVGAERFQLACILAGKTTSIRESRGVWIVTIHQNNNGTQVIEGRRPERRVEHTGQVWCPRTKNGSWFARRNGKSYFTGNTFMPFCLTSGAKYKQGHYEIALDYAIKALKIKPNDPAAEELRRQAAEKLRIEDGVKAATAIYQLLKDFDEHEKAAQLLGLLPYPIQNNPEINSISYGARQRVDHLFSSKKFQEYFSDPPYWEPTPWEGFEKGYIPGRDRYAYILSRIRSKKNVKKILIIGCDDGLHGILLAKEGYQVTGIDLNTQAIKIANDRAEKLEVSAKFRDGWFETLNPDEMADLFDPTKNWQNNFDIVIASEVLEKAKNFELLLEGMGQCVKPGGAMILTTPNGSWDAGDIPYNRKEGELPPTIRTFTQDTFEALLNSNRDNFYANECHFLPYSQGRHENQGWIVGELIKGQRLLGPTIRIFCGDAVESFNPLTLMLGGIGGSETAVIHMADSWNRLGARVGIYRGDESTPNSVGIFDGVHYRLAGEWTPELHSDLLVSWRLPHIFAKGRPNAEKTLLWCHDIHFPPEINVKAEWVEHIDVIAVLSEWHKKHIMSVHPFPEEKMFVTRNGVERSRYFQPQDELKQKLNSLGIKVKC